MSIDSKEDSKEKYRSYCFTWNNPTTFDYSVLRCKYIIVGDEKAPTTGTPHHQGYITWTSPMTWKNALKKLPPGCSLFVANGTQQHNIIYCSKEKILHERGQRPQQGKRNDIVEVKQVIAQGGGMRAVIDVTNSYQAYRAAEMILKYCERKRDFKPIVKWYWGPTGTGKTRRAMEECKDPWISGKTLQWWQGYDAHEHVIIDDFRGDYCTFHELLRILDRIPYTVEYKGGSRQLLAKLIIITCPKHPEQVYDTREDIQQLIRRIDVIEEMGSMQ